jgi:hypothetical protein
MEGGTPSLQPAAVRIRDASGTVLVEGATRVLDPARNPGVCAGSPPTAPIWWSRTVPESVAEALRHHDYRSFTFEGQLVGGWKPLVLEDSGCRGHGQG